MFNKRKSSLWLVYATAIYQSVQSASHQRCYILATHQPAGTHQNMWSDVSFQMTAMLLDTSSTVRGLQQCRYVCPLVMILHTTPRPCPRRPNLRDTWCLHQRTSIHNLFINKPSTWQDRARCQRCKTHACDARAVRSALTREVMVRPPPRPTHHYSNCSPYSLDDIDTKTTSTIHFTHKMVY